MDFGGAIKHLKAGEKVARSGWNGKGMWLVLISGSRVVPREGTPYTVAADDDGEVTINPHIDMKTATGEMQPGWLASQTDMLADDWQVIRSLDTGVTAEIADGGTYTEVAGSEELIGGTVESHAVYKFAGWLTSRDEVIVASGHNNAAPMAKAVAEYLALQDTE